MISDLENAIKVFYAQIVRWSKRVRLSIRLIRTLWINLNDSNKNCTRWEKYLIEIPFNHQTSQLSIKWNVFFFSSAPSFFFFFWKCFVFSYFTFVQHTFPILHSECMHWLDVWNRTNSIFSLKKKVFQTPFNFNMNELFFLIWMVDALVKFCISVADSCTDASFALGQLWWIAHTHTPEFQVIRKSFAAFTRKMAINISFPLWFLITFPVKIQWFFFSHCKVTFKRTLVESLVACSMISIWCQIYEKRFSSYLKY